MQDELEKLIVDILRHRGRVIGTLAGLFIGWITIRFGFLKGFLMVIWLAGGYYIGSRADDGNDVRDVIAGWWSRRVR